MKFLTNVPVDIQIIVEAETVREAEQKAEKLLNHELLRISSLSYVDKIPERPKRAYPIVRCDCGQELVVVPEGMPTKCVCGKEYIAEQDIIPRIIEIGGEGDGK